MNGPSQFEFLAGAQQAHEDAIAEIEAAFELARKLAHAELKASFLLALDCSDTEKAMVPVTARNIFVGDPKRRLIQQPLGRALWDALCAGGVPGDAIEIRLIGVIRADAKLSELIATTYADVHAEGMAEMGMQNARVRRELL